MRSVILALAAIGGWLDGLTFVALGSVFVSAVTGDLVQVGIASAEGDIGRLVTLLVALGCFLAGTSLAVLLERTVGATAWPGPAPAARARAVRADRGPMPGNRTRSLTPRQHL